VEDEERMESSILIISQSALKRHRVHSSHTVPYTSGKQELAV
jgi:hypothetical protein